MGSGWVRRRIRPVSSSLPRAAGRRAGRRRHAGLASDPIGFRSPTFQWPVHGEDRKEFRQPGILCAGRQGTGCRTSGPATSSLPSGSLESYVQDGKELVAGPLVPNYWRSETDNDRGNGMARRQAVWHDAGVNRKVTGFQVETVSPRLTKVTVETALPAGSSVQRIAYSVYGNGSVEVESVLTPGGNLPDLPRIGLQMQIPGEFRTVAWYGRGPEENYWDRNTAAAVGRYSASIDKMWFPYPRPQETGNRTDVRWATFTNAQGIGWKVTGLPTFYFSAWPFHMTEIDHFASSAPGHRHPSEIVFSKDITVNLDYRQMGIGGDDGWGARPHAEYTLPANEEYRHKFRLEPIAPAK